MHAENDIFYGVEAGLIKCAMLGFPEILIFFQDF